MRATNSVMKNADDTSSQSVTLCKCCGARLAPWTFYGTTYAECKTDGCELHEITLEVGLLASLTEEQIEQYAATNLRMRFRRAAEAARETTEVRPTW